jgi:hypothetical protein
MLSKLELMIVILVMIFAISISDANARTHLPTADDHVTNHDVQNVQQIDCQAIVSEWLDGTRKQTLLCFYTVEIGSCEMRQNITMWRNVKGEFGFVGGPSKPENKCE